jgi:hypothetical protein
MGEVVKGVHPSYLVPASLSAPPSHLEFCGGAIIQKVHGGWDAKRLAAYLFPGARGVHVIQALHQLG